MKQYRWIGALVVGTFLLAACGGMQASVPEVEIAGVVEVAAPLVEPEVYEGNPTCTVGGPQGAGLGYYFGFKPQVGGSDFGQGEGTFEFEIGGLTFEIWVKIEGREVSFRSESLAVAAVIVKGGPSANVYDYADNDLFDVMADSKLVPPASPNFPGVSHVDFCFSIGTILRNTVLVTKTADTEVDRDWTWDITKVGDATELVLSVGQVHTVKYEVTVSAASQDTRSLISGEITVKNNGPFDSVSVAKPVDEILDGVFAEVDCEDLEFPYSLAAGAEFTCTYEAFPVDFGDATSGVNVASVDVTYGGTTVTNEGTAAWDFADATVGSETNECIEVTDDQYGDLGTVCASDAPKTFEYSMNVGPYESCGEYAYVNVASFVTNDDGNTGSDKHTVTVDVPCAGCTLTQGYWKTHSEYGPAPYDDTWALLGDGADTLFFASGMTWYRVFWTPPAGNAYYNLAHQYMAAKLNLLNGAGSTAAVDAAIASAEAFFAGRAPTDPLSNPLRRSVLGWAKTLDDYNNGLIGPGHCSE